MAITLKAFVKGLTDLQMSAQIADQIANSVTTEQYESTLAEFKAMLTGVDAADVESLALNWLKSKQTAPIETEKVNGEVIEPTTKAVKVVAFKLQPSYRADDKSALTDEQMNLNKSHFEIQGVQTDGTIVTLIVAFKQMYHNLGMTPPMLGVVKRDLVTKDKATSPVKDKVIGQFVIVSYNAFAKGNVYRIRDDSNHSKFRSYTAAENLNSVVTLALDEAGEFAKDHEIVRVNRHVQASNDIASNTRVKTAKELLGELVTAQNAGLEFDAVQMLKALVG